MTALALASSARGQQPPDRASPAPVWQDGIVAVVEGEPITRHELELSCRLDPAYRALGPDDLAGRYGFLQRELELLVLEKLLDIKAREAKVVLTEQDERRLAWELERAAERYGGVEGLRQALLDVGVTYERYVERKRRELAGSKLVLQSVSRDINVRPEEVERYYEANRARYERRGATRLRQILVATDPDMSARFPRPPLVEAAVQVGPWNARAFIDGLRERIVSGELPFEDAQRDGSMGPTWNTEEVYATAQRITDLVEPLPDAVARLAPGEVSPVIESRAGFVLVLLVDRVPAGALPLVDVQEKIELELKEQVWNQRRDAWIREALEKAHVERFLQPPGGAPSAPPPPPGKK
jgi:hypothetical protein